MVEKNIPKHYKVCLCLLEGLGVIFHSFLTSCCMYRLFYNKHAAFITEKKKKTTLKQQQQLMTLLGSFLPIVWLKGPEEGCMCALFFCLSQSPAMYQWRPQLNREGLFVLIADIWIGTACPFHSHPPGASIWALASPAPLPDFTLRSHTSSVRLGSRVSLMSKEAWTRKVLPDSYHPCHTRSVSSGLGDTWGTRAFRVSLNPLGGFLSFPSELGSPPSPGTAKQWAPPGSA